MYALMENQTWNQQQKLTKNNIPTKETLTNNHITDQPGPVLEQIHQKKKTKISMCEFLNYMFTNLSSQLITSNTGNKSLVLQLTKTTT